MIFLFHIRFRWKQGNLRLIFLPDVQGGTSSWAGVQTPTYTLPGAGTVPGSCGQGGGCGREEVESPFSRAVSPASRPGARPQHYLASVCGCVKLGPVPGAFREITDLTSPMLLDPQNTEHGRWGTGQPQSVQEEGAG